MPSDAPTNTASTPPAPTNRKRGAPKGNQNRRTHGNYARPTTPLASIDDVIADAMRRQSELTNYIDARAAEMTTDDLIRLFALHGQNASRLGRLLRDARALSGKSADSLLDAIGTALDEINTQLGTNL
jgi:hypothetical protein